MKKHLLVVILCFCSIQMFHSQEDDGVVALSLPVRNSLTFNRFVVNPTFSFVREQHKYVSLFNKREWIQFDNAPLTYLASYSGRFGENIGAGIGLFQQDYGVLTTFGGTANFAYNVQLARESNLTFGLNIGAYKSGINTGNIITNVDDPALQNIPENFLLTINPGINYGLAFIDFGLSINNLAVYNFESSEMLQDNPEQGIQAHIMYTGYVNSRGFFDDTKFTGLVRSEFKKDETVVSALAMLTIPKGFWVQAGYNSVFGISGGAGINITPQIALEYNFEKAIGELTDFGPSHDITLAYRFKNRDRYDYSSGDEVIGLVSGNKKKPIVSKTSKAKAEANRKLAAEKKAQQDAEAEAKRLAELKAKQDAEAEAKRLAELKAQQDAKAEAKRLAEIKAQQDAETEAKRLAEIKAQQDAEAEAKRLAELKAQQDAEAEAKRLAELKAQQDTEAEAKRLAEIKAQQDAEAEAKRLAELKAQQDAEAEAKRLAELKAQQDAEAEAKRLAELKAQQDAEAEAKRLAEIKAQQDAEAEAKRLAELKAQQDAEAEAKRLAELKAQQDAEAEAKRLAEIKAQQDAKNELITNPKDQVGKELLEITKQAEDTKKSQNDLLKQFDDIIGVKDKDLKDLKEENDLSEQGITVQPKPFKSITAENNKLNSIKSNLDNIIEKRSKKIQELQKLYNDNFEADTIYNDEVYLHYRKKLKQLKTEQAQAVATKNQLEIRLNDIKVATEFERRRRIKRAAFDNEDERFSQDRAVLQNIKKTTTLSQTVLKEEDFDFGEKQSNNIQILKNVKNIDNGYYVIIAVHTDKEKRNEFVKKVIASGRTNVDFFYDIKTSKYYIYYDKFNSIEQANEALKSKGSRPYNKNMSLVKIEN
ncbi:PorP/SprF family type IX secretion system membrane protein [Psychroserpens sp.]|uniref:PorP/SprF family type IX secretion system membrane protein n=1 Tax=Psychroserpens sp. TaxID=2020870 RepID=UPI003858544D